MDTLKEVFDTLPISKAGVALGTGYTPEYVRQLAHGRVKVKERRKKQLLKMFEDYFHELGHQLINIKLTE